MALNHKHKRPTLSLVATLWLLLTLAWPATGQPLEKGHLLLHHHSAQEYEASEQNWAFIQDKRGIVYIGNNEDGVLEYDGERWRKIAVTNGTIVRALALGQNGVVYVGVVGDFGRLEPNDAGSLEYRSLVHLMGDSVPAFSDVYKVHAIETSSTFAPRT